MTPKRAEPTGVRSAQTRQGLTYAQARAHLYSLEHWGIKLGLQNIEEFCCVLGNPQDRFLSVHVAGTNGKGSTSAFLESILRAAGYRTGRYTSPHLRDFRERIHVNGRPIPAPWVAQFVATHWPRIQKRQYTYFEVTTALAFEAFARAGVDIAVVEVGLGGRFDATNVINPILSVITRIARDHEQILGHSAREIAFEKAGIIKPGVPIVIGPLAREAEAEIRRVAEDRYAPLWTAHELLADGATASLLPGPENPWQMPLAGGHQMTNLSIAAAAAALVHGEGIQIPFEACGRGVSTVSWPARFQIDHGQPTVVYDAAHNPDGARAVAATWLEVFANKPCVCVFNTRPDKDYPEMIAALTPIVASWVSCPMPDSPFIPIEKLQGNCEIPGMNWHWRDSPQDAMRAARSLASADGAILVTGSHYLIGAVVPPRLLRTDSARSSTMVPVTRGQLIAASEDRGADF